jgi:signal transduction histidine kinase
MQSAFNEITLLTVLISTALILLFGASIIYFIFLYQRKRLSYQAEIAELREMFQSTLLHSKMEIQEQTLDHIAKELHDNFSPMVSVININLSAMLMRCPPDIKELVVETKAITKNLMTEFRSLSAALNTDHIMHIGFEGALERLLNQLSKSNMYVISIQKSGTSYRLSPEREIILFRMCQEVINNIVRHAKAKRISISLAFLSDLIKLEITDDGIGFDVNMVTSPMSQKEGTGISNISKRAQLINAKFSIDSIIDKGTKFTISIPR